MLKKKNFLKIFLMFVFSFVFFGANLTSLRTHTAFATPTLSGSDLPEGGWSVEGGTLTLNGVNWVGTLALNDEITNIDVTGENVINGFGELSLNLEGAESSIHISGDGELVFGELGRSEAAIYIEENQQITYDGKCYVQYAGGGEAEEEAEEADEFEHETLTVENVIGINYLRFEPAVEDDVDHEHEFAYSVSGATLTATCNTGDCEVSNTVVSTTLSVGNVVYGNSINPQMSELEEFNFMTSGTLSLDSATKTYYKTQTAGATSGGYSVENPTNAGYYYVEVELSGVQDKLVCAFEIQKANLAIQSTNLEINYQATSYNLKNLFTIPTEAGSASYEIVSNGSTGTGTISGSSLKIEKCGTFVIKVVTAENNNYNSATATATLTVNKVNLTGLSINVSTWTEDQIGSVELVGNLGGGEVTYTYYTNSELTALTNASVGADSEGGKPRIAGDYYVKASVAESDNYNAAEVSRQFTIVGGASVEAIDETTTVKLSDLTDGRFDISSLFDFVSCDDLVKTYYLVDGQTSTKLSGNIFNVTVRTYKFKVVVSSATGQYIAEAEASLVVQKSITTFTIDPFNWFYGNNPVPPVQGNAPAGLIEYEYYTDAEFTQRVDTADGIPTEVGTYYVKASVPETDTTTAASTTTTCTIKPRKVSIEWSINNYEYNGQVQIVTAVYKDINQNYVELNVELDKEFKDAQNYVATASFKNGETSYVLPDVVTKDYRIRKIEAIIHINNKKSVYGNAIQELTAYVESGYIVDGEEPYTLSCDIPQSGDMGEYQITGTTTNPNYDITFINGKYLIVNKITSLSLANWVYGEEPNVPVIEAHYGAEKVVYTYRTVSGELLTEMPTEPGLYQLIATISDEHEYYCAERSDAAFVILKITVAKPAKDYTNFVYDGQYKTYSVLGNGDLYTISGETQRNAGNYKVEITLKDPAHYTWDGSDYETLEYSFVINKKIVSTPVEDARVFKYNGNNLVYYIPTSPNYVISGNVQSEIGYHEVKVYLVDQLNTCWQDGSSEALTFDFVIRKANITNPNTTTINGEEIENDPATVIATDEKGIDPSTNLKVVVINQKDSEEIESIKDVLASELKKYETIFKVYDISLDLDGVEVQPDGTVTLKLAVPEELLNMDFKLYHIHTDVNGQKEISEVEFTGAGDLGYIIVQTDKLSEFAFVYEQNSLTPLIVTFACLMAVLVAVLALQVYFYVKLCKKYPKKKSKKKAKKALAAAPAMFVGAQVAWSIILGILNVLLIAGNIVLLILILKKLPKKEKEESSSPDKAIDMSKITVEKDEESGKVSVKKTDKKDVKKDTKKKSETKQEKQKPETKTNKKKTEVKAPSAPARKRGEVIERTPKK